MWTNGVTTRFRQTLSRSHTVLTKVEILRDNVVQQVIEGSTTLDSAGHVVSTVDGSVRVSRAASRRSLESLQLLDVSSVLTVDDVSDLLAPLQSEVRLYRGVSYYDATPTERYLGTDKEYVPIGTFGVTKINTNYPIVEINTSYDRMARVTGSRFTTPWSVKVGSNLGAEIRRILLAALPPALADIDIPDTPETTPTLLYDPQDYMGEKAYEMATAAGWVLYVDPLGTFRIKVDPKADPDQVVANYEAGANSMLLDIENELDASNVRNAVYATGEASDGNVVAQGYAEDDDPASLTYTQRIGTYVEFYTSPLLQTNDQASAAARTYLRSLLGIADTTLVTALVDPTLDVDDVVRVVDPNTGRVRYLVADDFTIGLRANASMPINCRTVSAVF